MQATHIKTDGTSEVVNPKKKFWSLGELQSFVGGFIEFVRLPDDKIMVVNEEGKINGLPENPEATRIYQSHHGANDVIVGNVLITEAQLID
jgi:hypothetical protein